MVGFAMFSSFLLIPQFAQAPESTGYGFGFSVTAGRPDPRARRAWRSWSSGRSPAGWAW